MVVFYKIWKNCNEIQVTKIKWIEQSKNEKSSTLPRMDICINNALLALNGSIKYKRYTCENKCIYDIYLFFIVKLRKNLHNANVYRCARPRKVEQK